jgi:hypothetical protein
MATLDLAPHLPASKINTILAKNASNLTIQDLLDLEDALNRFTKSRNDPMAQLGTLFP